VRLSTVRLWISLGFGLLVTELALLVFFILRTRSEINELEGAVRDLKKENQQQGMEIRTLSDRFARSRRGTAPDESESGVTSNRGTTETTLGPAEWIAKLREAVLRQDADREAAASGAIRGFGTRGVRASVSAYRSEPIVEVKRALLLVIGSVADPEATAFLEAELAAVREKPLRLAILAGLLQQVDPPTSVVITSQLTTERDAEVILALVEVLRKKVNTDEAAGAAVRKYDSIPIGEQATYLSALVGFKRTVVRLFFERVLRESTEAAIRIQCIRGIAECGDPASIPALELVRKSDSNEEVLREADRAISKLRQ